MTEMEFFDIQSFYEKANDFDFLRRISRTAGASSRKRQRSEATTHFRESGKIPEDIPVITAARITGISEGFA